MEQLYKIVNGKRIQLNQDEYLKYSNKIKENLKIQKEYNKQARLLEAKSNIEKEIYEKYPLFKQCNIAIYGTDEEKINFKNFHDEKVKKYDSIVAEILKEFE